MTGMPSIITLFGVKLVVMPYTAELHNNCTHNLVLTCSNKITAADVNKWTTRTFRCSAPEYSCTLPHVPLWRMNLGCSTIRRPLDHHSTDFCRCCAQCHVLNYTKLWALQGRLECRSVQIMTGQWCLHLQLIAYHF